MVSIVLNLVWSPSDPGSRVFCFSFCFFGSSKTRTKSMHLGNKLHETWSKEPLTENLGWWSQYSKNRESSRVLEEAHLIPEWSVFSSTHASLHHKSWPHTSKNKEKTGRDTSESRIALDLEISQRSKGKKRRGRREKDFANGVNTLRGKKTLITSSELFYTRMVCTEVYTGACMHSGIHSGIHNGLNVNMGPCVSLSGMHLLALCPHVTVYRHIIQFFYFIILCI